MPGPGDNQPEPPAGSERPPGALRGDQVPEFDAVLVESPHVSVPEPATGTSTRGGRPNGATSTISAPTWYERQLWLWPVLILLVVAAGGELWGPYGGLMSGLGATAVTALAVGRDVFSKPVQVGILLACAVAAMGLTYGTTLGVRQLSKHELPGPQWSPTPSPSSPTSHG
jgi:hypothetical protein